MQGIQKVINLAILSMVLIACSPETRNTGNTSPNAKDSTAKLTESQMDCDTLPTINFKRFFIADSLALSKIRSEYNFAVGSSSPHRAIITLNRKEFRFFRIGDTIVVPDRISDRIADYSIFPPCYPEGKDIPKIVFVSNKYQSYACYENGKLVRFAAANTGNEKSQTYPGRYSMNWKERVHHSSIDSHWVMPYTINFHFEAGNAFHQFTMPGRPVSHSCIRQFASDAEWLYKWGDRARWDTAGVKTKVGTTVIILDIFDFSRKKFGPWLDLASNKSAQIQLPKDPMNYELALIPISQIPPGASATLGDMTRYINAEDTLRARGVIRPNVVITRTKNYNVLRRKRQAAEKNRKIDSTAQM